MPCQSQSHITTDSQSASQSWCQAPSGAQDQIFVTVRHLRFSSMWGALSDEATGLSFVVVIVSSTWHLYLQVYFVFILQSFIKSLIPCGYILFTVLYVTLVYMYVQYMQSLCQCRLGTAGCARTRSSCYNSCLVTWTVVHLTAVKFKPLIFSVSGFSCSSVVNICIFVILYDLCLLLAQFLSSNGCLFSLHYSGFQPSCHNNNLDIPKKILVCLCKYKVIQKLALVHWKFKSHHHCKPFTCFICTGHEILCHYFVGLHFISDWVMKNGHIVLLSNSKQPDCFVY
jgi:hypothetical protein